MRVFVFEHLCATVGREAAGGAPVAGLEALVADGLAMWEAVAGDLERAGCEVRTVWSPGLTSAMGRIAATFQNVRVIMNHDRALDEQFDREASAADVTLVIAPETEGWLLHWLDRARRLGAPTANTTWRAARRAGDKLATAASLQRAGAPTPPTWVAPLDPRRRPLPQAPDGWVTKARFGAGCQASRWFDQPPSLDDLAPDTLLQPWVPGRAVSVLGVAADAGWRPWRACSQIITRDDHGALTYRGGVAPIDAELDARAIRLARRAVAAIDGLNGFVGVDLILGEHEADDAVIEINPRLTTSYCGLRRLTDDNLTRWLIPGLDEGGLDGATPSTEPAWLERSVRFDGTGRVVTTATPDGASPWEPA